MKNIISYVEETMEPFSVRHLSEVDSLVLSQFSYIFFDTVVPEKSGSVKVKDTLKAEYFPQMFHEVRAAEQNKKLLFAMAASPRFRDLEMCFYANELDEKQEKQFSAVTFCCENLFSYIAFRGTDATFVGWKEDFNMAFLDEIPAQRLATAYLNQAAEKLPGLLYVGGHSKGGNLAVYAAIQCRPELQNRIAGVYSHDGPGFKDAEMFRGEKFRRISGKLHKTIPQSSMIGMLLENHEAYTVVKSAQIGLMQHDPFSWEIGEDGQFRTLRQLTSGAEFVNSTLHDWIEQMPEEQVESFVNAMYDVVEAGGVSSTNQFSADWLNESAKILAAVKDIDPETKMMILQTFGELGKMAVKNLVGMSFDRKIVREGV